MQHEECLNYSGQKWHAETGIFFLIFQVHNVPKLAMSQYISGEKNSLVLKKKKRKKLILVSVLENFHPPK